MMLLADSKIEDKALEIHVIELPDCKTSEQVTVQYTKWQTMGYYDPKNLAW